MSLYLERAEDEIKRLRAEVERLHAERAGDQQRLFHYEAEIERLRRDLEIWRRNGGDDLMRAEIERLRAEKNLCAEMLANAEAECKELRELLRG
jgi:chromosome segregation ATPase